jgi:hypothetical protein
MMPKRSTLTRYTLFEGGVTPSRVRVFFNKPIKDKRLRFGLYFTSATAEATTLFGVDPPLWG